MTSTTLPRQDDGPDEQDAIVDALLTQIDEVADELSAQAPENEALGCLTDRSLEILKDLGLGRLLLAPEYGGHGLYPGKALRVIERVAEIDGSTGWIASIVASTGTFISYFDHDAAHRLLNGIPLPMMVASGAPNGRAVPVDGGYRFSGSYAYSSGGLHADYVFCSGFVMDDDEAVLGPNGAPVPLMFMVPSSSVTHAGNWDTLGLRGTGSVDFSVSDMFVPKQHAIALFGPPKAGGPASAGGFFLLVQLMHLGWALGQSRHLLQEITTAATRQRPDGRSLSDNTIFRQEYARAHVRMRAVQTLVAETWADVDRTLAAGESISRRQMTLVRGVNIELHDNLRELAHFIYRRGGGGALRQGTMQRAIRDALAGVQHAQVNTDGFADVGYELLGAPAGYQWVGAAFVNSDTPSSR